jgi:predicted NBD/HSP70 family sugar kinase
VTVAGPDIVLARAGLTAYRDAHGLPRALDELTRRYRGDDPEAVEALDTALAWIRIALANCVILLRPQFVVIGGYLAGFVDELRRMPLAQRASDGGRFDGGGLSGIDADSVRAAVHGPFSAVDGALLHDRRQVLLSADRLRALVRRVAPR